MKKNLLLLIILLMQSANLIFAQNLDNTFYKTYGTGERGILNCTQETSDLGFISTGKTGKSYLIAGTWETLDSFLITKTDIHGNLQWSKSLSGFYYSEGIKVLKVNEGNYVVLGLGKYTKNDVMHTFLIKCDIFGNILWKKNYEKSENCYPSDICNSIDGGFAITSTTSDFTNNFNLLKVDSLGAVQYSKKVVSPFRSYSNNIISTSDNGYLFNVDTGFYYSQSGGRSWVNKMDNSGNLIWSKVFFSTGNTCTQCIYETSDGNILVRMSSSIQYDSISYSSRYLILLKLTSAGDTLWTKKYSLGAEYNFHITESGDGNYIIASPSIHGTYPSKIFKTDTLGNIIWNRFYNHTNNGYPSDLFLTSISTTSDDGYVFSGESNRVTMQNSGNGFLIKTDSLGLLNCNNYSYTITIFDSSDVKYSNSTLTFDTTYYATNSLLNVINKPIMSYTYCETIGIEETVFSVNGFSLYPNPANTQITIAYKAEAKNARIELFNATGQKINSFIYFNQNPTIDISDFANGLYLVKITDGKNSWVQRFVKN